MIRVSLPFHLRSLARVDDEIVLGVAEPVTTEAILDALEARYPVLKGTIRDHTTKRRRPLIRFYACNEDLTHEPSGTPVPASVANGEAPFLIIGAIAGG